MKGTFKRSYRSKKTGNTVFVYAVNGSDADMSAFEEAQGEFFVEDQETGEVLWFTTNFAGKHCDLLVTAKGNVIADMSAFDQANSLAKQYGGNLGIELAKSAAQLLLGTSAEEAPAPVATPAVAEDAKEFEDLEE